MVTVVKIGDRFFVSGSTIEGAAYARHFAGQPMQDFDFMLVEGSILSPDCLIQLKDAKGFVQVKYDEKFLQQFSTTLLSTKLNQNGILCINGFKMKEKYCGTESITFFPTSEIVTTGRTEINSASTEIKFKSNSTTMSLGEQFENTLNSIRRIKSQENIDPLQSKYILACNTFQRSISEYVSPLFNALFTAEDLTLQTFQDIISLTFPVYNIQMPQINKVRLNLLLKFYEKYSHLGTPSMIENYIEYGQSLMDNEADFVPALQLQFWPDDIKRFFLDRIQNNRSDLYKLVVETSSMHLIPKWSTKTSDSDQHLEFRYSFSAIERLLASKRTKVEQILNGVARSIYYKYLKKQPILFPSYVIKTTVLWMCELNNLNDLFTDQGDDQTIAYVIAKKWMDYMIKILSEGVCQHYFIDEFNLLESCSSECLSKAIDILQNQVDLNENSTINIFPKQDELVAKYRKTTEDWLGNLKVNDILEAINEYKILKENWLCPSTNNQDEGDAVGCIYILSLLRTLDGNDQSNWKTFQRLFLEIDETNWLPAVWGEQVESCSIPDFVDGILSLGSLLTQIQMIMDKPDFDGRIRTDIGEHEIIGTQNMLNDLITPSNSINNGLMSSWLPMFASSHFNGFPTNISSDVLSSFQQRAITNDHPIGPLKTLLQGRSLPAQFDSSTRQQFNQNSQHVSDKFFDLLHNSPDYNMTLNDLIKYYDQPSSTTTEVETTTSSISKQMISYATNLSLINREELTLIVFDPNLDIQNIEEDAFRSLNDYVLFYADTSQLLTYVRSINEEKVFIISFDLSIDEKFLTQLQNLNQIDSIYIYSFEQQENYQLLINKYSKIIGIYNDRTLLLEQLRTNIEQKSTLTFTFCNSEQIFTPHTKLSHENVLFLWNLLLKDLLINYLTTDKSIMIDKCREYYSKNSIELENIKQFEHTYQPTHAYQWYSNKNFISKQLNKAFHTIDIEQMKLFSFFIRDLSSNIVSTSPVDNVYCTTTITINEYEILLKNIGQFIVFDRFLAMNSSPTHIMSQKSDNEVVVIFEVINARSSNVCLIDSNRILFDLGTIFQFESFEYDDHFQCWIARLTVNNNRTQIVQNYIISQEQRMERMTLPIIMGDLLMRLNDSKKIKKYFENLQNEDEALIFYYYGQIDYKKGEYDLALENYQISYQLMESDQRIKDSAFLLHDIGYVYDMKKDFDQALESHRKALEIRKEYYPGNDVHIGISFYNIGRSLVNLGDNDQALIYHQKALDILKQTLEDNDIFIAQSLHSHGVVYFNQKNYSQALHYYTKALELYETTTPRSDHCILMVKNALETIKELISSSSTTQ